MNLFKFNPYWIYICPVWIFPILYLFLEIFPKQWFSENNSYYLVFSVIYSIIIRFPHFWATSILFYKNNEIKTNFLEKKLIYIIIPIVLFTLILFSEYYNEATNFLIQNIIKTWGFWHITAQGFGFSLILQKTNKLNRWLTKSLYINLFFINICFYKLGFLKSYVPESFYILFVIFFILNIIYLSIRLKDQIPALLYNLIFMLFSYPLALFSNPFSYFIFYDTLHSVNYIYLTYLISDKTSDDPFLISKNKLIYYVSSIGLSILLILLFTRNSSVQFFVTKTSENFLLAFFWIHYYYETFIWRDKDLKLNAKAKTIFSRALRFN